MLQEQLQLQIDQARLVPPRPYSPANQGGTGNDEQIVEGCPLVVGPEWGPDDQTEGERQLEQGPVRCAEGHRKDGHIPDSPAPRRLVGHVDRNFELELTRALACPCGGMPWENPTLRNAYGTAAASGPC